MKKCILLVTILADLIHRSSQITTIHHDKPEESSIHIMATTMTNDPKKRELNNITLTSSERQKRLLSYVNFYETQPHNQVTYEKYPPTSPKKVYTTYNEYQQNSEPPYYQAKNKLTPFSENNAIPGPFRPMVSNPLPQRIKVQYVPIPQNKVPNFSELYDKLAQLKLSQNYRRPTYLQIKRPPQTYIPKPHFYNEQKLVQPSKTTIETYTATNIDIPTGPADSRYEIQKNPGDYPEHKPYVNAQIAVEVPYSSIPQENYNRKPYTEDGNPFIIVPANHHQENRKPIIFIQRKPSFAKKPIPYDTPKYVPQYENRYEPVTAQYEDPNYEPFPKYENPPNYEDVPKYQSTPNYAEYSSFNAPSKNSVNLAIILKHLQSTNTLPKTLTPDNIDNSIKTLVKILNALKKQQKGSKPIVVQEEAAPDYSEDVENEAGVSISGHPNELPGTTVNELYPEDTDEGGTPGKPGVDYPALASIPQTNFNCKTQRYKGFFGDPDTNCQVWHYCDLNGGQASFLCPNGTIFSQVALTCDWWYNVKCSSTAQLYVLNERLYKYIIPLSPKFPEDYTGPLVDKYLALKFQEMEEKMRKEKIENENKEEDKESSERQDADADNTEKVVRVEASTKNSVQKETLETVEDDNDN